LSIAFDPGPATQVTYSASSADEKKVGLCKMYGAVILCSEVIIYLKQNFRDMLQIKIGRYLREMKASPPKSLAVITS
jgi:hypothetical protein